MLNSFIHVVGGGLLIGTAVTAAALQLQLASLEESNQLFLASAGLGTVGAAGVEFFRTRKAKGAENNNG